MIRKDFFRLTKRTALFLAIFCLTTYLLLNAYELFFRKDIGFINSVTALEDHGFITNLDFNQEEGKISTAFMVDGEDTLIETMRVTSSPQVIRLSPMEIDEEDQEVLVRPAFGNTIFINDDSLRGENSRSMIIYISEGWRININQESIKTGVNIFTYSEDGTQYIFRITSVGSVEESQFIPVQLAQSERNLDLLLLIENGDNLNYVHAQLISTLQE